MTFKNMQFSGRRGRLLVGAVAGLAMTALGVGSAGAAMSSGGGGAPVVYAKKLAMVVPKSKEGVAMEGGAFGPEGDFFFDSILAKPGEPKIIKLDPKTKKVSTGYSDKTGLSTSTQFDSKGNLWVTDFNGAIDEMN